MVSLAPCSEMDTEPCPGEQERRVVETNEPELKEAYTGPGDKDSQKEKELSHGPQQEDKESHGEGDPRIEIQGGGNAGTTLNSLPIPEKTETPCVEERKLKKTPSFAKTVRFSETESVEDRESTEESLFPDHEMVQWIFSSFEELFLAEDWQDITDDRLLRKKVLAPGPQKAEHPAWGQEVTVKMQGVLEDRTVVEKDPKLVFVIGEGDVNQALEECAIAMQQDEITLLLADSQYTYGLLGREPDIPAWAPLLYQLQLLNIREKPDPLILPISDRIRIGNQKRERGNFHFQREEYSMAARAYWTALDVLTTRTKDGGSAMLVEGEEVLDYRVKCLNNLAAAQLKLEQYDDALHTSRDVLSLDPQNVKALFRTGKAIHVELSKLVKRQSGGKDTQKWQAKPAQLLGDNIAPFLTPSNKKPPGISWKFLLGALVVALGSLVTSVVLTARN
ncbi:peptidyl-prolyl cis-trans isomerase FKBP8-like isoform X2 [Coregonus clupeaformis]|uniref:peptidyl-prolyl cis-trans isomerase FKBP8-like isoform X2 n=1 Tax=Coregonus clupeaformis TaxID=59861 RepID=UPI001E1C5F50|nr:peptidyl-prolyl cis-trans isomerase FKBP8-like isoform X2 [Coregonus clupeaformis]